LDENTESTFSMKQLGLASGHKYRAGRVIGGRVLSRPVGSGGR